MKINGMLGFFKGDYYILKNNEYILEDSWENIMPTRFMAYKFMKWIESKKMTVDDVLMDITKNIRGY